MESPEPALSIEHAHPSLRLDPAAVTTVVRRVLAGEGCRLEALTIVLTDHATVRRLNRSYLDHDYHTDVLAFSYAEDAAERAIDGEVYVDLDTAQERHEEFGATFAEEALRYVAHGVLHLVGYTDHTPAGKAKMHSLEDRYLAGRPS